MTVIGESTVGLQSTNETELLDATLREVGPGAIIENPQAESFANPAGNPVLHGSNVYLVYWDPTNHYHGDWQGVIDGFFSGLSADSGALGTVFAVDAQYTDKTNVPAYDRVSFRGSYTDTHAYPTSGCADPRPLTAVKAHLIAPLGCITDQQIQQELQTFVAGHGLPKGIGTVYYLLTPPGLAVCLDAGGATSGHCSDFAASEEEEEAHRFKSASYKRSFCSYHSDLNPDKVEGGDANTVVYGVVPWTAGGLGDGQLAARDHLQAAFCQDGGFNPASSPIEEYEGPVIQEPNQVPCPSPDGYCDTGLADLIVNQLAIEQQNITTNPLLNAWQDSGGNEATDECRNFFAPTLPGASASVVPGSEAGMLANQSINGHTYFLNTAFNKAATMLNYPAVGCLAGVNLLPKFTAPHAVNAGDVVSFDGMESTITLNAATNFPAGAPTTTYATYAWNFGDGSAVVSGFAPGSPACETPWLSPCAASVFHAYQYGGEYQVTLTVTDVAGNVAVVSQPVVVVGPPPPVPPSVVPGSPGGPAGPGSPSTSAAPAPPVTKTLPPAFVPPPVVAAAASSHSLKSVLRKGLVVRYSVNEQVAGHFDVLLAKSIARRLGIGGAPAFGLAPGTPAQVVIAKAILVTTKAGSSTVDIQLSKHTAARLKRLHKVSLLLRLMVHNAGAHSNATTTVLSTVVLSG